MANLTNSEALTLRTANTTTWSLVVFEGDTVLNWWNIGAYGQLARFCNSPVVPSSLIWRDDIQRRELINKLVGSEFVAGTTAVDVARRTLLDVITKDQVIDATLSEVRANFSTAAGAGSVTLANWTNIARRPTTYFESLFAGAPVSGAVVSPRYNYKVVSEDLVQARNAV